MTTTPPPLPDTHPLETASLEQALARQQSLVAAIAHHFPDGGMFQADAGVAPPFGQPVTTRRAERALAEAFGGEDALLVQGAGTGAIRTALSAGPWAQGERRLLLHDAPAYSTTSTTFRDAGVDEHRVDFNDLDLLDSALAEDDCPWVYLQHTRQRLGDRYRPEEIIRCAVRAGRRVIVDDNYAVLRVPRIGTELGAAASAFSLFKLHGPEGVGVIIGDHDIVDQARTQNYSGGGQVQGWQALAALQALVMAPLNWARQSTTVHELGRRLAAGEVDHIVDARVANAQDLCVIALLDAPIADRVPAAAATLGAAPYPVGSNSRFEITPLVYRMSSSSLEAAPALRTWALRINPMRAGADLTLQILRDAVEAVV